MHLVANERLGAAHNLLPCRVTKAGLTKTSTQPKDATMPRTYTLLLTGSSQQAETLKTAASGASILCTDNCGTDPTVVEDSTMMMPAVRGSLVATAPMAQSLATLGAAADATISLELKGFEGGHAVVALHWQDKPIPTPLQCSNCPPDTQASRYPPSIKPAVTQHVLEFKSAAEADSWVSSVDGQAYLKDALYLRVKIPA